MKFPKIQSGDSKQYPNDNHPMSEETWHQIKQIALNQLSGKRLLWLMLFVVLIKITGWQSDLLWKLLAGTLCHKYVYYSNYRRIKGF